MTTKTISVKTLQLSLLPVICVTILISICLTTLYFWQLNEHRAQRELNIVQQLALVSQYALRANDLQLLLDISNKTLEEPGIRTIEISWANGTTLLHIGPSFFSSSDNINKTLLSEQLHLDGNHSNRHIHPIYAANNNTSAPNSPPDILSSDSSPSAEKNIIGWLDVEFTQTHFSLMKYQAALISLLLLILGLVLAISLGIHFNKKNTNALTKLLRGIQNLSKGDFKSRIEPSVDNEYSELTTAINDMAISMNEAQQYMQQHIDQSTEDLRETLETIEIQNIELDLARKEALEASRMKSEFLANTSHEIRTPLNGIIGFTSLLLKTNMSSSQKEYLQTIQSSSQGLLTIINDILDFSKIEAGKLILDYSPLHLRRTIEETLQILAPGAHEKQLQLILLIDNDVPLNLLGDPLRFKQVLTNLISNAVKFSDHGNVIVQASLQNSNASAQNNQVHLKVSVSDNGIGLTDEQQEILFSAFEQADSSNSREHGGTGLGLAISKGIAERMGGEIGVDSTPEEGATFWFSARLGLDQHHQQLISNNDLSGFNIGIYDSNTMVRLQLGYILESLNAKHLELNTLHDIMPSIKSASIEGNPVNLLLMNVSTELTQTDLETLRDLINQLEQHFHCKTVVLATPSAQRAFNEELQRTGAIYINKPVIYEQLYRAICLQLELQIPENYLLSEPEVNIKNTSTGRRPRILAVDDNPANLQLVGELLMGLGAEVTLADSGQQALDHCQKEHFDLAFMDIQMPGMDGIETTQHIRSQERSDRRTPIIALTAHAMTEQKSQLLLAGFDDYLSKPCNEAQLAHIINRWLTASRQQSPIQPIKTARNSFADTRLTHSRATVSRAMSSVELIAEPSPLFQESNTPTSPVNIEQCLQLANNKEGLARDMLAMLLKSLPTDCEAINTAYRDNEYPKLEEQVHRLHGGSCYTGVPALKRISRELDRCLQKNHHQKLPGLMEQLNKAIAELLNWEKENNINRLFDASESQL